MLSRAEQKSSPGRMRPYVEYHWSSETTSKFNQGPFSPVEQFQVVSYESKDVSRILIYTTYFNNINI